MEGISAVITAIISFFPAFLGIIYVIKTVVNRRNRDNRYNRYNRGNREENDENDDENNEDNNNNENDENNNNNGNYENNDENDDENQRKELVLFSISVGDNITSVGYINNNEFEKLTPNNGCFESVVSFSKNNNRIVYNRKDGYSVVYDILKFAGKRFDEIEENELNNKPYKIIEGVNGYCEYEVLYNNRTRHYTPTYVLSLLFKEIKRITMIKYGYDLEKEENSIVLTIPVDSNYKQRKEIIKSANESDLKVEKLISEPIAASYYYLHNKSITKRNCNILVCDLEGNSFKSSIINKKDKTLKIISTEKYDRKEYLEEILINNDIDYVVLNDESSSISRFDSIIKRYFPPSSIFKNTNPQDIISAGACWYLHSQSVFKQNNNIRISYGIDLGTTFSSSAFVDIDKKVDIIQNEGGKNAVHSFVFYNPNSNDIIVGEAAVDKLKSGNIKNLLYNSKRFIGKKYNEILVDDIRSYPFEVVEKDEKPSYKIIYNNEEKNISPIEVSSEILKYIHKYSIPRITHENISEDEIEIVIGVPAAFTNRQRESTKESGILAGFKNIDLISEPTAAALSYIHNEEITKDECLILVYDFGGGTFDVSIIKLKHQTVTVLGTFGDEHLGGEDLTKRLEDYVKNYIKDKFGIDINENERYKARIYKECEKAKINLSGCEDYNIDIELGNDIEYEERITRSKFEELCLDKFNITMQIVNESLQVCNINKNKLDYVIFAGGSSQIPKLREMIKDNFRNNKNCRICYSSNTNEDVAKGCAIYSKCLIDKEFNKYRIIDNSSIYSEDGNYICIN